MDFPGHTQYISYVATYWRVPLATEGWQMFQPPLFYYLEAVIFRLFLQLFEPDTVIRILKLLPLVCGAAQVEISYRTLRYAYPGRESLQVIGTLIGGLLPMNLYMSQSIGNEPLVGCLTALIIFCACRALSGDFQSNRELGLIMGFTLGLAMLTHGHSDCSAVIIFCFRRDVSQGPIQTRRDLLRYAVCRLFPWGRLHRIGLVLCAQLYRDGTFLYRRLGFIP
jgi:hypothetical protein